MADLDDFFAKKDRKKSKGKKFTTTEEIAKKLEETEKRMEKMKLKEKAVNPEEDDNQPPQEDEEWKNFEEEKKDYTGLKLGNLPSNIYSDEDSDDERGTGENSSDGESGEARPKQTGPWKKPEMPEVEPAQSVPTNPGVVTGNGGGGGGGGGGGVGGMVYKSPHLRNQPAVQQNPRSRMKNVAPDIRSEEYFPTLNAKQPQNSEPTNIWGRRKRDEGNFEEVRNRGSNRYNVQDSQSQAPKLSLDNKYGALSQDQS
ncbi:protein CDV3 homolog [Chelonus insularis]|uniref:protein CDV3 homolog n=1 Tax=Chelonus insularis TaxID=460826 RepID=UPI00158B1473|nr:protein CDV3 homolog [Chelonus insularis]